MRSNIPCWPRVMLRSIHPPGDHSWSRPRLHRTTHRHDWNTHRHWLDHIQALIGPHTGIDWTTDRHWVDHTHAMIKPHTGIDWTTHRHWLDHTEELTGPHTGVDWTTRRNWLDLIQALIGPHTGNEKNNSHEIKRAWILTLILSADIIVQIYQLIFSAKLQPRLRLYVMKSDNNITTVLFKD